MRKLGEDISEMLDLVPGYFKVIRHVRPKLSCGHCSRVVQQPAPPRPIARGMAAPGLLAQIIVAKYADHCPLYRQQGIYRRSGVELDRATLAAWVGETARLLEPLVNVLGRYVLAAEKVHADDTPVPVLDPGRGKTKTGRLWTYVRDDRPAASRDPPAVWYRYSPNRKGEHPQTHLRHFRGILQADAYAGFGPLYANGKIVEAACWAHYLEFRIIWSHRSETRVRRGVGASLASHKSPSVRETVRTPASPASVSTAWHVMARSPHASRSSALRRASFAGSL
jgi:transposase